MGQDATMENMVFTDGEVADLLKVSRSTVRRLWWRKELPPPLKIGIGLRWRQSDILDWLESKQPHGLYDTADAPERKLV